MSIRQFARLRTRWSAIGAAVAVSLGAGGIGLVNASIGSGDKPVTVTVDAKRILDTRANLGLSGRFADATPRELQVTGDVPVAPSGTETVVPDGATAVLVNVTVVFPSDPGFLALRSGGATGEPSTSTVNFFPGTIEPNAATVDLSSDGKIQIWVETSSDSGNAHVLVDVVGYTIDHTHDDRYYTQAEADAADGALETKIVDSNGVAAASGVGGDLSVGVETVMASLAIDVAQAGMVVINAATQVVRLDAGSGVTCDIKVDGSSVTSASSQMVGVASGSAVPIADTVGAAVTAGLHDIAFTCTAAGAGVGTQAPTLTVVYSANDVG
jgi:hypothetical protein